MLCKSGQPNNVGRIRFSCICQGKGPDGNYSKDNYFKIDYKLKRFYPGKNGEFDEEAFNKWADENFTWTGKEGNTGSAKRQSGETSDSESSGKRLKTSSTAVTVTSEESKEQLRQALEAMNQAKISIREMKEFNDQIQDQIAGLEARVDDLSKIVTGLKDDLKKQ